MTLFEMSSERVPVEEQEVGALVRRDRTGRGFRAEIARHVSSFSNLPCGIL
jgi:hypothetical protein